jgi:hypothetical protein
MLVSTRDEALHLVKKNVSKKNIIYHMLGVEAIMRTVAKNFGEDKDKWGLIGLLHDIDYDKTEATPETHSLLAEEILKELIPDEIIKAIMHACNLSLKPDIIACHRR